MGAGTRAAVSGLAALVAVGLVSCVDLNVANPNAPDAGRALSTPAEVEALIASAFARWTDAGCSGGPSMFLSVASGEHSSPWACGGMEQYARIPRISTNNQAGVANVGNLTADWYIAYEVSTVIRQGLKQIHEGIVDLDQLSPNGNLRARAYGRFVQGLAYATIAALYDSGFVYDETMDPATVHLQGYQEVMEAALGYFAEAAALARSGNFTVPATWMSQDVSSATLAQLAHAMAARFRAVVARTPAERQAVAWDQVVADVEAGITADWDLTQDCNTGEFCPDYDDALLYRLSDGWQMQDNWLAGMADTSGAYQAWINTPKSDKVPFIIHTPDRRWPSGPDEATQLANPGDYYAMNSGGTRIWNRPDRGTWRWSYYEQVKEPFYTFGNTTLAGSTPLITLEEMNALKAEAAYRAGNMQVVADFVNATRTRHGLLATDAAGSNTNCVPRLPSGACGDLWEMFKWEKRLETQFAGPLRIGWYFDGRGWGDLIEGTILQFPVPYGEMALRQLPPYDYGGVGGPYGAPKGTYDFCSFDAAIC